MDFSSLQSTEALAAWASIEPLELNNQSPKINQSSASLQFPHFLPGLVRTTSGESNGSTFAEFKLVLGSSSTSCSRNSLLSESSGGTSSSRRSSFSEDSRQALNDSTTTSSRSSSSSDGSQLYARDAHTCTTTDGWKLHITHAYDPARGSSRQFPVLMVPGLASSSEHTFDLTPECSLVDLLIGQGFDCWLADLRGNGQSQKPSMLDRSTWWAVDHHLLLDVPAVLEYVLSHTGASELHWIGHSMGGMLAVGLLSQQGKYSSMLRSITMLASGCFGAGSWHSLLRPLINRITKYGFPAGLALRALSILTGTAAALWPIETLFFWPGNMPAAAAKKLLANCFRFIPVGVIEQFMGSLNSPQGLCSRDCSFQYADPAVLQQVEVPVLGINGSCDLFCPALGGRKTVELFGSSSKQFVCMGPWHKTSSRNYGHFDVVSGRDVHSEVFPYITSFLQQHDDAGPQLQLTHSTPAGAGPASPFS